MAGTLDDEIMRVTGGPTVNDGLRSYFLSHGASGAGNTLPDLERDFLLSVYPGASHNTFTNNDLWMGFLDTAGYAGTLNDRQLAWWSQQ